MKGGSLLHTDTLGNDFSDPSNVRFYFFSSLPHSSREAAGFCQQPGNPVSPNPGLRALLVALDQWTARGIEPPRSRLPRRADGSLVPVSQVKFPRIPGVSFTGVMTTGDLFDFWWFAARGNTDGTPPKLLGTPYPVLVPQTDSDGNDLTGIRFPDVAVPLATYTGWSVRQPAFRGRRSLRRQRPEDSFRQHKSRAAERRRSTLIDRGTLSNLGDVRAGGHAVRNQLAKRAATA